MKTQKTKLGFTLIELMVVITIIGILATGAVSVYTSQIQKARDSNRTTSIKALQSSIEQAYSDLSEYPGVTTSVSNNTVATCSDLSQYNLQCLVHLGYMDELPEDPKTGKIGNGSALEYAYNVGDKNNVSRQVFEVSAGFEAAGSVASKADNNVDKGGDNNRLEIGNSLTLVTRLVGQTVQTTEGDSSPVALSNTQKSCEKVDGGNAENRVVIVSGNCGTTN